MDNNEYRPRIIDGTLERMLKTFGAVCVEGPKWCGKTWTAMHHSKSSFMLGNPARNFHNRNAALADPNMVLDGEFPRLIDEWHEVPAIWDAVRYNVDMLGKKGCFLLTGSATPVLKGVLHSGVGRIANVRMRPMSLFELGDSCGSVSLADLFNGCQKNVMTEEVSLKQLIRLVVCGGWPGRLGMPVEYSSQLAYSYIERLLSNDVFRSLSVNHDVRKMSLLLKSLARNESTTVTNNKLSSDISAVDEAIVGRETVALYLSVFQQLFIIDDIPPFSSHLRSSVRVKQSAKRHFVDPSLPAALLNASVDKLFNDLNTFGFLFESLCLRDLIIYAESLGGTLCHYQDYNNKEIDAVVCMPDGSWGAFEIKLGANQIDAAAEGLLKIKASFEEKGDVPPKIMVVICGLTSAAYRRPDGVYVVPITALKP